MSTKQIQVKLTTNMAPVYSDSTPPETATFPVYTNVFTAEKDDNYWECISDPNFDSPFDKSTSDLYATGYADADVSNSCDIKDSEFGIYLYVKVWTAYNVFDTKYIGGAHYEEKDGSGDKWFFGKTWVESDFQYDYEVSNTDGPNTDTLAEFTILIQQAVGDSATIQSESDNSENPLILTTIMKNPTNVTLTSEMSIIEKSIQKALKDVKQNPNSDKALAIKNELNMSETTYLKKVQEFYTKHKLQLDGMISSGQKYLKSEENVTKVKALEIALSNQDSYDYGTKLAEDILQGIDAYSSSSELAVQGTVGRGIGVSAGVSLFAGPTVGVDIIFDNIYKGDVMPRKWGFASVKSGLSASAGLNLSLWVNRPFTGVIKGGVMTYVYEQITGFIRFITFMQLQPGDSELSISGVAIQLPLGIGLPIRKHFDKKPGLLSPFVGKQTAWDKTKRAIVDVLNTETGMPSIAVQETADLSFSLKNTYGEDMSLSEGTTLTINMPSYFEANDVDNMKIAPPTGWEFSNEDSILCLVTTETYSWPNGSSLELEITNVTSSSEPPQGQASYPGKVSVTVNDPNSSKTSIVATTDFDLVWSVSKATLNWKAVLNPTYFNLSENCTLNGETTIYAQPGNNVVELTSALQVGTNEYWVLGVVFNYNTAVPSQVISQVTAVWWNNSVRKANPNYFPGNVVSSNNGNGNSTSYYAGVDTTDSISIDVTFD